jgi:hypothetical protein
MREMLRCKAGDAGRSRAYDAKERNEAYGHLSRNPLRGTAFRAVCIVTHLAKGVDHSLRRVSRIPSRKANTAASRGFSTDC